MRLTDVCIERPVLAWMIMAATVLCGAVALGRIGISQYPDVDAPVLAVSLGWPGAAPEVMEHDVVEPVEEAVSQVEGVRSVASTARQGSAQVTVELDLARDVDAALQDVQSRLARIARQLPSGMDPPAVSKSNPEDQPILWASVSGPFAPQLLADVARYRVAARLQTLPGVGEIVYGGQQARNVRIWVDGPALTARNLTVTEVVAALAQQHVELPAGHLTAADTEMSVRVLGEALDLTALRQLVVAPGPAPVRLGDVALVEDGFEDVRRLARVDGRPAMGLGVRKQRGANAVAVAQAVRRALTALQPTLPSGMAVGVSFDATQFIAESVHEIEWEIGLAVLLTALVCWLFLGSVASTFNVLLAIPMSLLGTVAVLYFCGFTLNTFTLLALGLAVGIVVDDAIMVMENITRHAEGGKAGLEAARDGTHEITFAALSATLAVVAIFAPVIFMRGVIGRFFLQFGVALSVAVLLSYVEAVTLAPARCAQMLAGGARRRGRLGGAVDRGLTRLAAAYERLLRRALRQPARVVAGGAVVFASALVALHLLPTEFVPSQDQSRLLVRLTTAVGASLEETDRLAQRAHALVRAHPEVTGDFSVIGGSSGVNGAFMFLTLAPPGRRQHSQADLAQALRRELRDVPGLRAVVQDLSQGGFTAQRGFPVSFSLRGDDIAALQRHANGLREALQNSGLVVDLDADYAVGMAQLSLVPRRQLADDLGVSADALAQTLGALVGGVPVGKFSAGGRRIDMRLRLLQDQRRRPEDLSQLYVRGAGGALVNLAPLVEQTQAPAMQAINRLNRERAVSLFANVAPGHAQGEALAHVRQLTAALPADIHAELGGQSQGFDDATYDLLFALGLGLLVAYMVLAAQFDSLVHPVTVLTILPLSVAGALWALWFAGKSLNIFSMIGLLLLLGIVKKNAIVLTDYAVAERRRGRGAVAAMLAAGPVRLRPILMTSAATMMAVLPAVLHLGPGAETRGPMGVAVLGGLVVSTALSLLVVPAFYVLADRASVRLATARRAHGAAAAASQPAP